MRIKLCRVCGLKQKRYENVAEEIYEMVIIIESLIGILLFTILIVPLTLKNRLTSVGDYPPTIREKCMELGLIEKREQRFTRAEYKDYCFHIKQSCIGMLLGLPACLAVGTITAIL